MDAKWTEVKNIQFWTHDGWSLPAKVWQYSWFNMMKNHSHTRRAPLTTISGFIPSYSHLQPWLNKVCRGYNYLITRGAPSCRIYVWNTYLHFSVKNGHMNKGKWRKVNIPFVLWIRKWDCKTVEFLWDCKTHSIHGEYHLPSTLKINHVTIP